MSADSQAYVALNMLPHIGPVRLRRLLAAFGSAPAILTAKKADLLRVEGIGQEVAAKKFR